MSNLTLKTHTALRLGIANLARVVSYRIGVRLGMNAACKSPKNIIAGPFFHFPKQQQQSVKPSTHWYSTGLLFSYWPIDIDGKPPNWHQNYIEQQESHYRNQPWWKITDFDPALGDIKTIWELSRFEWSLTFASRIVTGDNNELTRLNYWLTDWCQSNPPFLGSNWKCGQEAAIRVIHLSTVSLILDQITQPEPSLLSLLQLHIERILPTMHYAKAQDNNHAITESAALFIVGEWFTQLGYQPAKQWARIGRQCLENRVNKLIGEHGTFSQYSLNYQRLVLDVLSITEVWRNKLSVAPFSKHWYRKALVATRWLYHIINPHNGDGPNVGANDGAYLLHLAENNYRDHRPTVQLAMVLFAKACAYLQPGNYNTLLTLLRIPIPIQHVSSPKSWIADDGGFAMLRHYEVMVVLRYPRFCYRPSQADALHVDLWIGADNMLRDAGTYSYHSRTHLMSYFSGTAAHNTIQFDNRDQMPRLSRFLFGYWLKTNWFNPLKETNNSLSFGAGYRDCYGASHRRRITLSRNKLQVIDQISGFKHHAVLRWRLLPGDWQLEKTSDALIISSDHCTKLSIQICSSLSIIRSEIVSGWESRHYLEKTPLPVVEVEVNQPGSIITEIAWFL